MYRQFASGLAAVLSSTTPSRSFVAPGMTGCQCFATRETGRPLCGAVVLETVVDENVEQLDLALELDAPLPRRCEELLARYAWAGTCSYHTQTTLTVTGACEMCDLDALYTSDVPRRGWSIAPAITPTSERSNVA